MQRIALFPGMFDPPTFGHHDIIERASLLFDTLWLGVGNNSSKTALVPFQERVKLLEEIYSAYPNIKVAGYEELTVNFCQRLGAKFIIRGLRSATDFDYERNIAAMNQKLAPSIETLFLISRPEYAPINSSIVREIWKNKGDISSFVDEKVVLALKAL